ncbi:MAG: hypothetical protein ACTS3F_03620 [Phycisphaerales bacterium]
MPEFDDGTNQQGRQAGAGHLAGNRAPTPPHAPTTPSAASLFADCVDHWANHREEPGAGGGMPDPRSGAALASLHRLMALLDPADGVDAAPDAASRRELLINITAARVRRAGARGADRASIVGSLRQSACDPASSAAIDSLVESGWETGSGNAGDRAPATRAGVGPLLALLGAGEPFDSSDRARRVERTMDAVRASITQRRHRMRLDPEGSRNMVVPPRRFQLADVGSIAAMLLIGIGVLWPMLVSAREQARTTMCASGMQQAGLGFGLFANDHDGRMPAVGLVDPDWKRSNAAPGTLSNAPWWNVGERANSHSANLFVIVRLGYTHLADTACPGNERAPTNLPSDTIAAMGDWAQPEQVSYSYQLFAGAPGRFGHRPGQVVVSDRSPVVDQSRRGEPVDLLRSSRNHGHAGQNALRQDGAVVFLTSPVLGNGDNIWLPRYLETRPGPIILNGRELPADDRDVFLGP